jgi:hypothetical protein
MASKSSLLGALLYETETNFGETTTTTATRLRPWGTVTYDLSHPAQKPEILRNRPHEGAPYVRMPMAGTVAFDVPLPGMGSTTAGAVPSSDVATLLGLVFGTVANGLATGTTATGGTAAAPTLTAATGITAGALVKVGAKGDGRGDGQFVAVSTHAASTANLLTALPAAPNNGDVVYASKMIYESSTPGTYETISSVRILFITAQQAYLCHGCYPTAAEFSVNVGEIPRVRLTYAVSWWEPRTATLPSAVAVQDHSPAPVAGGSLFLNAVGTATRSTVVARSVAFSVALSNLGEPGVGGYDEHQLMVGASRSPSTVSFELVVDSEAAGTDTYGALFDVSENSRTNWHALYTMTTGDGRATALYLPNMTATEARPVQFDDGGVLRKRLRFDALTGATTTTDLTASPWRLALA